MIVSSTDLSHLFIYGVEKRLAKRQSMYIWRQLSIMYGSSWRCIYWRTRRQKDFAHAYFLDSRLSAAGTCSKEFGTAQSVLGKIGGGETGSRLPR